MKESNGIEWHINKLPTSERYWRAGLLGESEKIGERRARCEVSSNKIELDG